MNALQLNEIFIGINTRASQKAEGDTGAMAVGLAVGGGQVALQHWQHPARATHLIADKLVL